MAIINWSGARHRVTPVRQLDNGDWLVAAAEHGPRWTIGTHLQVKAADVVSIDQDELPTPPVTVAAVQAAMDKERKPTLIELLAKANAKPKADAPVTIPTPTKDNTDMSKLSALADLAATTTRDIEAEADRAAIRLNAAKAKAMGGIAKLDGVSAEIEKGIAAVEDLANQLTNGGPPLEK